MAVLIETAPVDTSDLRSLFSTLATRLKALEERSSIHEHLLATEVLRKAADTRTAA